MKKIFKILGVIAILVVLGIGLFIGWIYLSEHLHNKKLDRERINDSTTLSKYVEYHDWEHTKDDLEDLRFSAEDIKCDVLKDKDILYYYGNGYDSHGYAIGLLILDDYTIYKTAFGSDKTYSNGQQCKQIAQDIKFKRFQIKNGGLFLISENNKYYEIDLEKEDVRELDPYDLSYEEIQRFIEKENIKKVQNITNDNGIQIFAVLKDDGQIYEQHYQYKYDSSKYVMINEKVLFSNKDYGNITDFLYNYMGEGNKNNGIDGIVSDKGLFYLKQTDDQKYIDTEQTYEMVASDIYNKYKSDIKYINGDYIFTTDNNIIKTKMICRDIDKEVK